ncbi:MAG: B12-binding domain-containing radical SAM protein, partial [Candidatus Omnitrophica bacterium]|nr:B12-binding domain-containing radical SAM protein [Candidatus Omnitrophota bacterium]
MKIAFISDWDQDIGLQYLTAVLKQGGHEVKILADPRLFDDLYISIRTLHKYFDFKNEIINEIKSYKPDLVGFSATTNSYHWACELAESIKKNINVPIIIGGTHSTLVPERVIKNACFDMVCIGEGEYPLLELVNSMAEGRIDFSIKNIWFKNDGQIIKNDLRQLIENLDSLPLPDKDVFYQSCAYYSGSYYAMTTRGCPNSCSYCGISYLNKIYENKYFRQRSVDTVIHELEEIKKDNKKLKRIIFMDNCFGSNINWLKEFSKEYSRKIGINFICMMYPSHITPDSVKHLKLAGCKSISFGIQTWDTTIRENLLNRKVSNETMIDAIELCKKIKIETVIDNIFAYPGYDDEDLIESLLSYTRHKPTRNNFHRLQFYPKTVISQKALANNWITPEEYENILEGKEIGALRYEHNATTKQKNDRKSKKIQILFIFMDLLPRKLTYYIIKNKLYRYFPSFLNLSV